MHLHVATAKAVAVGLALELGRHLGQQTAIELGRRDVADHGLAGGKAAAVADLHALGHLLFAAAFHEDARHIGIGDELAAMLADDFFQRLHQPAAAALDDGHAAADHGGEGELADHARGSVVRAHARVQHPGRNHGAREVVLQITVGPAAAAFQRAAGKVAQAVHAARTPLAPHQLEHVKRIGVLAQQAKGQRRIGTEHAPGHGRDGIAITGLQGVEALHGVAQVLLEAHGVAAGHGQARGVLGLQDLQAGFFQRRLEFGIAGAAHEQRIPGGHDLMLVAGKQLFGADAAAQAVIALQHQDFFATGGQQGRAHQGVDAAADENDLS